MMETGRHKLPCLAVSQAQKEITHNEALALIDALVHPVVEEQLSVPPAPTDADIGKCWLIGSANRRMDRQEQPCGNMDWRWLALFCTHSGNAIETVEQWCRSDPVGQCVDCSASDCGPGKRNSYRC